MPMIIGALVAALINAARMYLPGIVGRILLALGIGFVTHKLAMPALLGMLQGYVNQLPGVLRAYFGAIGLDVCATMIFSALAARMAQKTILKKLEP